MAIGNIYLIPSCVKDLDTSVFGCLRDARDTWLDYVGIFVGILAISSMVYAIYLMITSNGDPQKLSLAKNVIFYVFIGILLVVAARYIVMIVMPGLSFK